MRAIDLLAWRPLPTKKIIEPILAEGVLGFIFGEQESFKSAAVYEMAHQVAEGSRWLAWRANPCRVLLFNAEIPEKILMDRQRVYGKVPPRDLFVMTDLNRKFDTEEGLSWLRQVCYRVKPKLVIIDNLYRVFSGDLRVGVQANRLLDVVASLRAELETTFFIVSHARQKQYDMLHQQTIHMGIDDMYGSSFFKNNTSLALEIRRPNRNERKVQVILQKSSFDGSSYPRLNFEVDSKFRFHLV